MPTFMPLLLTFVLALVLSYSSAPVVKRVALRFGFQDRPSPRRDVRLKPRLGGLGMYVAFVLSILITAPLVESRTAAELQKIVGIIIGATLVLIMGAIDDWRELAALPQFLVQLLAAGVAVASGVVIEEVTNPFGTPFADSSLNLPLLIAILFTFFWLLGTMNTINFIDGLDGLAAGITTIAALVLFLHSFELTQYSIAVLPLALAGSALGFLPHNFYPAKVTMGTSGAVFLGYALGSLSVIGGTKAATILLVLGIPIVDAAWIIFRRLSRGQSPFLGDRTHLHHRLMEMGLSQPVIVLILYFLSAIFGTLALVLSTRLMKLYVLLGIIVALGGSLVVIANKSFGRRG